ncbi:hypothetical protein [Nocardiopsis sp. YSL2]|uniref:hypothetical protein n=1 Tax=Nocardiopsis sp. YSL2 TaxID=2939492 RepID=UPI0026F4100C|nr:hypothetical protein [Nocardiopsis sp. YSL2]
MPRVTGHVVLLVGDAVRMDSFDAHITAQALVHADAVTIHGRDPEGVRRIQAALDTALEEAAEEAYRDALWRADLPTETARDEDAAA